MYGLLAQLSLVLLVSFAISSWVFWAMDQAWLWKRAIRRFEKSDLVDPSQPRVVVFTGQLQHQFLEKSRSRHGTAKRTQSRFWRVADGARNPLREEDRSAPFPGRRLPRSAAMEIELMGEGG